MLMLALAMLIAAAPLDRDRAALLHVLESTAGGDGCSASERRVAAQTAGIARLGTIGGDAVLLASPHASCLCGTVNCPWFALRLGSGEPRVLLETSAFSVEAIDADRPLPRLRERAHDSALVVDETIDAYADGRYASVASTRVRADNGERKPLSIPIRFAPGASAALLRGSVALGWGDTYTFSAQRGQRVAIAHVRSSVPIEITLFDRRGRANVVELTAGVPAVLTSDGTFALNVDNGSDAERPSVPYAFTLSIR